MQLSVVPVAVLLLSQTLTDAPAGSRSAAQPPASPAFSQAAGQDASVPADPQAFRGQGTFSDSLPSDEGTDRGPESTLQAPAGEPLSGNSRRAASEPSSFQPREVPPDSAPRFQDDTPRAGRPAARPLAAAQLPADDPVGAPSRAAPPAGGDPGRYPAPGVRPASGESAAVGNQPSAAAGTNETVRTVAQGWLENVWDYLPAVTAEEQGVSLYESIRRGARAGRRPQAVQTYWRLCGQELLLALAGDEVARVEELAPDAAAQADASWQALRADVEARVRAATLERARVQYELLGLWPAGGTQPPRPLEMPFAGLYRTNFETLYPAAGAAPSNLLSLHKTLPLERDSLQAQAEATIAQARVADGLAQAYLDGQVPLGTVRDALDRLRAQRLRLVGGLVAYNQHIADYALAVGTAESDATLASMLIPRPVLPQTASTTPRFGFPGQVQPATVLQPLSPTAARQVANEPAAFRPVDPAQPLAPTGGAAFRAVR